MTGFTVRRTVRRQLGAVGIALVLLAAYVLIRVGPSGVARFLANG